MDDAPLVGRGEASGDLHPVVHGFAQGQCAGREARAKRLTLEERMTGTGTEDEREDPGISSNEWIAAFGWFSAASSLASRSKRKFL